MEPNRSKNINTNNYLYVRKVTLVEEQRKDKWQKRVEAVSHLESSCIYPDKNEEISHRDCGAAVEILPRGGIVHRLVWGSNSPSFLFVWEIMS